MEVLLQVVSFHSISSKILPFLQSDSLFTPYGVIIFYSVGLKSLSRYPLILCTPFFQTILIISLKHGNRECPFCQLPKIQLFGPIMQTFSSPGFFRPDVAPFSFLKSGRHILRTKTKLGIPLRHYALYIHR